MGLDDDRRSSGAGRHGSIRSFSVSGWLEGRRVTAVWRDAGPEGDDALLARARALVADGAVFDVPEDGGTREVQASLEDPAAAFITLVRALDSVAAAEMSFDRSRGRSPGATPGTDAAGSA